MDRKIRVTGMEPGEIPSMVDQQDSTIMDEYERKFAEMQKYIPFLEAMIERLKKVKDKSRVSQLQKMQSLHAILSDNKRKLTFNRLKIETLQRCEHVLQKLHSKVEKGNSVGTSPPSNKSNEDTKPTITGHLEPKIECTSEHKTSAEDTDMKHKKVFIKKTEEDETPASPSPPASPDTIMQSETVEPIIIPTERSDCFTSRGDVPASPDACEMIATVAVRTPIIIPTEREEVKPITTNPLRKVDPDPVNQRISRWSYPDGIPQSSVGKTPNLWQSDSSSSSVGGSSKSSESRPRCFRHIPTMPAPSKTSSVLRKPVLILEKKSSMNANTDASTSKFDPPSISEPRLRSPDGDSYISRTIKTSPKPKDLPPLPKLPTTSLLVSPPPVLTMPPLTIEDLAELLQDDGDNKTEILSKKDVAKKDDDKKSEKENDGKNIAAGPSTSNKDAKSTKNIGIVPMDIDREIERRWEEIDKPIVKLQGHVPSRKIITSPSGTPTKQSTEPKALGSQSGTSQSSSSANAERPTDPRNRPPSPSPKDRDNNSPRYAEKYEKHPRQSRDNHRHSPQIELNPMNSSFSRHNDKDSISNNDDNRGAGLYQRRTYTVNTDSDPRRENNEFYKTIIQREREKERERERREREMKMERERERELQREREIERELQHSAGRGMIHHSPGRGGGGGGEPCNQGSWGPNMNYPSGPQGPNMYPQQQRPDMWMQGGPNNLPMDPNMMNEPGHMRQSQYQGPLSSCGRPIMNQQEMNMGPCMDMNMGPCMDMNMGPCMDMNMGPHMDMNMGPHMDMNMGPCMDPGYRDDMPNQNMGPGMQGMMQGPQGYGMGPQYHQFPDNRSNVQQFDRPQDYQHPRQGWDQSGNRPPENIQYPRSQGPPGPSSGQWNRSNRGGGNGGGPSQSVLPPQANQQGPPLQNNRNFNDRGRIPENSRKPPFNRDPRDSRDSRDPREPRDSRDPRMRNEATANPPSANIPLPIPPLIASLNVRRDHPRFNKEPRQTSPPTSKPKEIPTVTTDRNQRRRTNDSKDKHNGDKDNRKRDEKKRIAHQPSQQKNDRNEKKRDKDNEVKIVTDKPIVTSKDVMQSPLESLYGVIDTRSKTGKGYGLQKFKIPKIRRPEPPPRAAEPPKVVDDTIEESWDQPDENTDFANIRSPDNSEISRPNLRNEADDKKSEVTSTTGETSDEPQIVKEVIEVLDNATTKDTPQQITETDKCASKILDSEQTVDTSTKSSEDVNTILKEPEAPISKEEVTQEMIEALIRKSITSVEVKKLLEMNLMQTFGEAFQTKKKFKKIQKIIDSESESSSDKEKLHSETKKVAVKKKRRVIVSDSSEEECLAERLGIVEIMNNDETEVTEQTNKENDSEKNNSSAKVDDDKSDDESRDIPKSTNKKGKPFRRKRPERKGKSTSSTKEQTNDEAESIVETNEASTEEQPKVPTKGPAKKPKRRNSLEMLQEDIREMFISEGVITATGHRMCRLIKEAQDNSNVSAEGQTKKGSTGSIDRQGTRNESDLEDAIQRPQSVNSKARGAVTGRSRRRRNRGKTQKSVKEIPTSDSESDEDSPKIDSNEANETTKITTDDTATVDDNSKNNKDDGDGHFLRRSERVGLRESMKDSNGQSDKADPGKMDSSSKTMFDSSSDESFGIDVSELTAAVDISLHPEQRGRITTSSPTAKGTSSNVKSTTSKKKRPSRSKQSAVKNEKNDVVVSNDEMESIASDLSRASSLTRSKKGNTAASKPDTNAELLSDILIELTATKTSGDADNDNEVAPIADAKAAVPRKKKKRPSWRLGIVRKKSHKKKIQSPITTTSGDVESASRPELEISFEESHETKVNRNNSITPMAVETKEEMLSDSSMTRSTENNANGTVNETFTVQKKELSSPVKNTSITTNSDLSDTTDVKRPPDELESSESIDENNTIIQTEFKVYDNQELVDYVWSAKQDRFRCFYCTFNGKMIVHHYARGHRGKEIMISRLPPVEARYAIKEARTGNYDKRIPKTMQKENRKFKCRFCVFTTEGSISDAIEAFYEHCTTHTGEYRFRCSGCDYQTVARSSMKTHYYKRICRKTKDIGTVRVAIQEDPVPDDDFLYGYLCSKCNFIQLIKSHVETHVKMYHENSPEVEIIKIDMSSHVDENLGITMEETGLKTEDSSIIEKPVVLSDDPILGNTANTMINVAGTTDDDADQIDIVDEALKSEEVNNEDNTDTVKSTIEQTLPEPSLPPEIPNDAAPVAGNLSAFVCPPELENKEDEIQLERQKKMEEIVKNIGLVNKSNEKRDLSITDKLKDKMTENLSKITDDGDAENSDEQVPSDLAASANLPVLLPGSVTSLSLSDALAENICGIPESTIKDEPVFDSNVTTEQISTDENNTEVDDKAEKKMKDPLTNLDEDRKDEDESSDDDESENDNALPAQPPSYESDSTEQSDSEIPADVNSLLEETFNINATSNAPMMTTIQRLAAKLQSEKPFTGGVGSANADKSVDDTSEQRTSEGVIPKKPNAIPISSIQKFLGRRNAMLQDVTKEADDVVDVKDESIIPLLTDSNSRRVPSSPKSSPRPAAITTTAMTTMVTAIATTSSHSSSPPKKFIRLRRLSGDKLSVPSPPEIPAEITPIKVSQGLTIDESSTDLTSEIMNNDTDEECSFIRIESVVSLAGVANNSNDGMIDDAKKTVPSTSVKSSLGTLSLLKKNVVNILNHPLTGVPTATIQSTNLTVRPATMVPTTNIAIRPLTMVPLTNVSMRAVTTSSTTNVPIRPAITLPTTNIPIRPSTTSPGNNIPIRPAPMMQTTNIPIRPAPMMPNTIAIRPAPTIPNTNIALRTNSAVQPNSAGRSTTVSGGITSPVPIAPAIKQNFKIVKVVRGLTLLKQKNRKHRVFGLKLKQSEVFSAMLEPTKLRQFYKCMARSCTYTTDCLQSFGLHYRQHKDNADRTLGVVMTYDFQRCPYCSETLNSWNAMSEHLKDKHIYCQYQCNYCFYRGLAQSYVELHQATVHQGYETSVLLGHKENPPIEVIDKREFVIPFVCHHECGKSFYVPGAFLAHLRTKHGNSLSIFKCHLCPAPSFKAEQLVAHYKLHGIHKYQCLYCLFGSDQSSDIHDHLSAAHYNRPPHILERTLQPRPVRDKDVIQQLIVLNVDESYRCTELTLIPGQDTDDIPKTKQWLQVDRNTTSDSGAAAGEVTLPIGNIGMNRLFSYEKMDSIEPIRVPSPEASPVDSGNSNNPSPPIITKISKISPKKQSSEKTLIVDYTGTVRKVKKTKDVVGETTSKTSSPSTATTTSTTVTTATVTTPSESPRATVLKSILSTPNANEKLYCNEEFLNFNILDHPEFLKSIDKTPSANTVNDPPVEVGLDDDDSDIEIIEDTHLSTKEPNVTLNSEKIDEVMNESTRETIEASEMSLKIEKISMDPQAVIVCSSNENSLDAEAVDTTPVEIQEEEPYNRPLTLDDIMHTGYIGSELYRCGYDGCEYGAETSTLLRTHIKECIYAPENNNLNCVHCSKRFVKIGFLIEHFKLHGLKRFGCSLCKERYPMSYQAMSHMKAKHKHTYTKLIPADPKNPSVDGLFIVEPIPTNGTSRPKKRGRVKSGDKESEKSEKEPEKTDVDSEGITFGPMDIESLPRQAIYQREVQCAVCPYTTKVRTNIIRHLQLHAKDETVPESGPVNPVPCLDKKERMFDKMVNLASSSHQNGRMGGKTKESTIDSDAEFLPKFIPEHKRYVCGVTDCNYLTCDESMLRNHLKALHPDEPHFRCPHCPLPQPGHETQSIAIDKMGVHLKMHDTRLYKCSHCNNHHYHRHVVERHLGDKHSDMNPYVKVIREPESTETVQQSAAQEEADEASADPDGNHWKCNMCDYKCIYKAEIMTHAATDHVEKSQFKCNACSYKTNNKISFDHHVNAKHPYDTSVDCTLVYEKIKVSAIKKPSTDSVETVNPDEPFDTTPLWRRDMPRVRHIRGILFDEENSSSPTKGNKRKSDGDVSGKSSKAKSAKLSSSDVSNVDDSAWNETISSENSMSDVTSEFVENYVETETGKYDLTKLIRKFGPLGSPFAHFFRCTICQSFKTKYRHDMRDHLYRDLKYWRLRCKLCGHMGVSKGSSTKHFMRVHESSRSPTDADVTRLPVDHEIETWVKALLKSQLEQMRRPSTSNDGTLQLDNKSKKGNSTNARRSGADTSQKSNPNITQSPLKDSSVKAKTVDLTQTISNMQKKSMSKEDDPLMDDIVVDDDDDKDDDDSRDCDALVIDNKEDGLNDDEIEDIANDDNQTVSNGPLVPLICKHCNKKTSSLRRFKIHVEVRHLKRGKILCFHCDTSFNSQKLMLKHLRTDHPGLPEEMRTNPTTNHQELTNDFWEKEYSLITLDRARKRKRNPDDDAAIDPFEKRPGVFHVCNKCGFRGINYFGLRVHMRKHASTKDFRCAYCTYASATKSELWQHSELNHSHFDWKVGNGDVSLPVIPDDNLNDSGSTEMVEKYQDYVEGVSTTTDSGSSASASKQETMYSCVYCNFCQTTIESVQEHWKNVHKSTTKMPGDSANHRTGLPFRYKELSANSAKKSLRCGYCPKRGSAAQIRLHSRKKHAAKPVKFVEITANPIRWVCHWCSEVCNTDAQKKIHHNMFHSHLAPSFKRQEITNSSSTSNVANDTTPGHGCPECSFKTTSRPLMEKHVEKHVDSVICKRCDKTFPDVSIGILHNTQAHPGEVSKIEGFKTNVEKMLTRVNWWPEDNQERTAFETVGRSALDNSWKTCGVARKSTTKSLIVQPKPTGVKAVARKSTNPLPRYPPGLKFAIPDDRESQRGISYYGKPVEPVNLTNISTYITLGGGRQMKLNCTTLAQLIDIEPCIIVNDLKQSK